MMTITYQSKALSKILDTDFWPDVRVNFTARSTRRKKYDTPFGPRYYWDHEIVRIDEIAQVMPFWEGEETISYAWDPLAGIYYEAVEAEAMAQIERYMNTFNFKTYEAKNDQR